MVRFTEFLPVPDPARTKVRFNIKDGTGGVPARDLLLKDDREPCCGVVVRRSLSVPCPWAVRHAIIVAVASMGLGRMGSKYSSMSNL
jgi:hypothetical protein